MIADTDGGMIEVVQQQPEGNYIEIPNDCNPAKFMNITAIDMLKKTNYANDYVFYDPFKVVRMEHLKV